MVLIANIYSVRSEKEINENDLKCNNLLNKKINQILLNKEYKFIDLNNELKKI